MPPACVRFDKKIKWKDLFQAALPETQIILAKLSHLDKIEPGSRPLYFVSARVFLYSGEKKYMLHKNRLSKMREERTVRPLLWLKQNIS